MRHTAVRVLTTSILKLSMKGECTRAKTRKKVNGEGSIVFDKARKRWRGYIPIGYDAITGSVKRKTFSATTKLEVVEMMEDFKRQLNVSPLMIENASTTIKEWMEVVS